MSVGPDSTTLRGALRQAGVASHPTRLIIGYGNDLRSDDGAGIRAATMIAARDLAARVIACQQLTPELADDIAAITPNTAVHVLGLARDGHGPSVQAEDVTLIELEDL